MAQAPVATQPQLRLGIHRWVRAQRLHGAGIAPAVHFGVGWLGANAGDLGKGPEQLGLRPCGTVVDMLPRPVPVGVHGPAFHDATPRLAGLARHPGDAVVRAARGVPLRAQDGQARLHRLGDKRPSMSSKAACSPSRSGVPALCQQVALQQGLGLRCGQGQQYGVETAKDVAGAIVAFGAQLPLRAVQRVTLDAGDAATQFPSCPAIGRGLGPAVEQRCACPVWEPSAVRPAAGGAATRPWASSRRTELALQALADMRGSLRGPGQNVRRVREILRTMVEGAKRARTRGHAPTHVRRFVEHRHPMTRLDQGACAGDAGHASTNNGNDGEWRQEACGAWLVSLRVGVSVWGRCMHVNRWRTVRQRQGSPRWRSSNAWRVAGLSNCCNHHCSALPCVTDLPLRQA